MELKNEELLVLDKVCVSLAKIKVEGALKFKFLKLIKALQGAVDPIVEAFNETNNQYKKEEILQETQKVDLPTFTYTELEPLSMSAQELLALDPLIQEEGTDV